LKLQHEGRRHRVNAGPHGASEQPLWDRIRHYMEGNAEGSTLRLTLGCLLAEKLGIELRRVGSGKRRTFADGESALSAWMGENAFDCWMETGEPWRVEAQLITSVPATESGPEQQSCVSSDVECDPNRSEAASGWTPIL
jgi:hypothetical protein